MTYTAAHHQGAIEMSWLRFCISFFYPTGSLFSMTDVKKNASFLVDRKL